MGRLTLLNGRSSTRLGPVALAFLVSMGAVAPLFADSGPAELAPGSLSGASTDVEATVADGRAQALAAFKKGMDFVLQGDMKAALPRFRELPPGALPDRERKALLSLLARFDGKPHPAEASAAGLDTWTAQLLDVYRTYWSRVMLRTVSAEVGEKELSKSLRKLLPEDDPVGAHPDMATLESRLDGKLQALGHHALFGVTQPYREFMLWRSETNRGYPMDLPGGREEVPVALLDGFVSLGWMGFASGDLYHTGGWAKPDRLYCVRPAYDLDSEDFRISYIAHEGQHFSDYRRFPGLAQPELEYRAKLVELSLADTTLKQLLAAFGGNGSDLRDQPHPFAQRRVMKDLGRALVPKALPQGKWWEPLAPVSIRAAAKSLLEEDTRRLQARSGVPAASLP
jgi:hypothetical protein